jgi:hypothetical protein
MEELNLLKIKDENDDQVINFDFIELTDYVRIYYKERNENNGFDFYCIDIIKSTDNNFKWTDKETECIILFQGTALFDGVRHLYFSVNKEEDFNGYLYYPNLNILIKALEELKKLEIKYCEEV